MIICVLREDDRGTEKVFDGSTKVTYFKPTKLGTKVAKPGDSNGGFGIKKANGKWATLTPDGEWQERDGAIENLRTWETFYPGNPGMVANRNEEPFFFKTVEMV